MFKGEDCYFSCFIPGEVPSSKNSKRWTGKILISSEATLSYKSKRGAAHYYDQLSDNFTEACAPLSRPIKVEFYFKRKTKRRFDYANIVQIVQDMMVQHYWIADDNCNELIPVFAGHEHNKKEPGVRIRVPKADNKRKE